MIVVVSTAEGVSGDVLCNVGSVTIEISKRTAIIRKKNTDSVESNSYHVDLSKLSLEIKHLVCLKP
jgi:hypothetical protein